MASPGQVRAEARRAAAHYGLDPAVYDRLIRQESGYRSNARSPAGALGPAQLIPSTARSLGVNINDWRSNIFGGAKYLRQQLDAFGGDYKKALAAYNAGPGAVKKYGGVPPYRETQNYVRNILGGSSPHDSGSTGSQGAAGAVAATQTTFTPGETVTPGDSAFAALLTQQLSRPQRPVTGGGLPDPAFSARKNLAVAGQQPASSSAGPVPKLSLSDQLAQVAAIQGGTVPQPPSTQTTTTIAGGTGAAAGGGSTRPLLERAVAQSNTKTRYQWGGGHGPKPAKVGTPVDCSGYVSMILGVTPRTSGQFMSFGDKGPGRQVTIYAKSTHVLVQIGNRWFGTSHQNPGGGAGEISAPSAGYLSGFVRRHPKGS